jgi:hypothetical protein
MTYCFLKVYLSLFADSKNYYWAQGLVPEVTDRELWACLIGAPVITNPGEMAF